MFAVLTTEQKVAQKFREARYGSRSEEVPPLRLLHQLDDENVPVEHNIFDSTPAHEIIEELSHKANYFVAQRIAAAFPKQAFLRRQAPPNARRLATFADRMSRLGYEIDTTSSGALQNSLFAVKDADLRQVSPVCYLSTAWTLLTSFREWKPCWSKLCKERNIMCSGKHDQIKFRTTP